MKIEEVFTTYWSQVTILLFAIAYFIKRIFDLKSKKLEINHSLFQQNKINTVNDYFKNYARAELMWQQLQIWNILSNKLTAADMDKYIWPPLRDLKQSVLELHLYFEDDLHKPFSDIFENMLSINTELGEIYSMSNVEDKVIIKANRFESFKKKMISENNNILMALSKTIRYHLINRSI
jgi:hypothetical protein